MRIGPFSYIKLVICMLVIPLTEANVMNVDTDWTDAASVRFEICAR
jgi:hypothetical protein